MFLQVFLKFLTKSVDQSLLDGYFYLFISLKLISVKKSVLLKQPHLITFLPKLDQFNEIHFAASWWALIKERCDKLCSNGISLNVTFDFNYLALHC